MPNMQTKASYDLSKMRNPYFNNCITSGIKAILPLSNLVCLFYFFIFK